MSADLELQKAIYARLAGDEDLAALLATRIYDNVPGDAGFPYLAIGENETRDWPDLPRPDAPPAAPAPTSSFAARET